MNITIEQMVSRSKDVTFIKVSNNVGFRITLSSLGAGIYEIYYHQVLTISPSNKEDYLWTPAYYGKTAGRVCGRIKKGQYKVGDATYQVECNEGKNCLHGGFKGFSYQNFTPKVEQKEDHTIVTFTYLSKDKEGGFNGNMKINVTYVIDNNKPEFTILYDAMSDQDTIFNITNHSYFTLDSKFNSLARQTLMIPASKYIKTDKELISVEACEVTPFMDFRKEKYFPNLNENERYDHDFILDEDYQGPAISLKCDEQKIALNVYSNFPIVHIYSANENNGYLLTSGVKNKPFNALAIECERNNLQSLIIRAFKQEKYYIRYQFIDL